ncbi:MAG: hypothetical protein L3J56_04365 [Bacteroidales bacterium]|nr:hypothetical protein [Bacteroidales bacterium]
MKNLEYIIFLVKVVLSIAGFLAFFIGLLASPIIYINIRQRYYFKKFSEKYYLKLAPRKHFIRRDFPYVSGKTGDKNVFVEATQLGNSYYNIAFDTYKYSSPVVIVGLEFNNHTAEKIVLTQKALCTNENISEFDKCFNVEIKPDSLKSEIFNNTTKQSIMNYSRKSQMYLNLFLEDGYLISILNFELTNNGKYEKLTDRFKLLVNIINNR